MGDGGEGVNEGGGKGLMEDKEKRGVKWVIELS